MTKGETELELIPFVEGGELMVLWQLHREGLGNAVELTTGQPSCMRPSWHTPCAHRPVRRKSTSLASAQYSWTRHKLQLDPLYYADGSHFQYLEHYCGRSGSKLSHRPFLRALFAR